MKIYSGPEYIKMTTGKTSEENEVAELKKAEAAKAKREKDDQAKPGSQAVSGGRKKAAK